MRRTAIAVVVGALLLAAFAGAVVAEVERGTSGSDFIRGTDEPDRLYGRGGNDFILGRGGGDKLDGGYGNDDLFGQRDADVLRGGLGRDNIDGNGGADVLRGEAGRDHLSDGPLDDSAQDTLYGGEGNDVFFTRNQPAARDIVSCGPGQNDTVEADQADQVLGNCEEEVRRR